MKIVTRGFRAYARELAMNPQNVPADADERELCLCEALDRRLARYGRNVVDVAPRGHDCRHERGYGEQRVVDPKFGGGYVALKAGGRACD
ncbi:hypothetical protein [Sphingopyxis sp.]|uniref:hypothetical protein n=1 Tax=Sphingopyxis sp. TaxID=1908224 RepID=UPI002B4A793D|nr:hypothetical protein [Sphingopyxis sp.]HJS13368.1 hypothetical protein [Sphingopyxis sp.]